MHDVHLPANEWRPRAHQKNLWQYLETGGKRAIAVWHRRAGKDEICLHHAAASAFKRIGNYWHTLPEFKQGHKAIWAAVNPHTGKRRIDEAFPQELRENTLDNEMFIRFKNGSTWQVIGSDRYDATVGAGVVGVTYSEWALSNPSAWAYHRPMLEENNGWAAFITTPRGRNHAFAMLNHARQTPHWFAEVLTAKDTGALTAEELAESLKEYVNLYGRDAGQAIYDQEMMCSFNAAILGAFYAHECVELRNEGRICECEPDYSQPVHHAWDLGVKDDTAIYFYQALGSQILILDVYANSGVGVEHYRDEIERRHRQYSWLQGNDYVPHDAKIKEWGSGRTRVETMQGMGLKPLLVPLASIDDGINAVRRLLPLCVFHPRAEPGLDALEQYRREWDDEKKAFRANPLHDWTSHYADAFRYLAMGYKPAPRRIIIPAKPQGWILPPPPEPKRGGIRL
jgi:phage terminase large subunit